MCVPVLSSRTTIQQHRVKSIVGIHCFEGVIEALLNDPVGFTVRGFEEYYSSQEKEFLAKIQKKILLEYGSSEGEGVQD